MDAQASEAAGNMYVALSLDKERYALPIASVREILELHEVTPIPMTPERLRGVVNVRGAAVPVVDLRCVFGMPVVAPTLLTRVVIVEWRQQEETLVLGLIADAVNEVIEIEPEQIGPPPDLHSQRRAGFLRGVARCEGRFLLVVDIDALLAEEESPMAPLAAPEAEDAAPALAAPLDLGVDPSLDDPFFGASEEQEPAELSA